MGKSRIEGTALNLSEHGMYIFTASNIPSGNEIEVVFCPPDEKEPIRMSAVVRRKVVYLYGIEFLDKTTQLPEAQAFVQSPDDSGFDASNSGSLRQHDAD